MYCLSISACARDGLTWYRPTYGKTYSKIGSALFFRGNSYLYENGESFTW